MELHDGFMQLMIVMELKVSFIQLMIDTELQVDLLLLLFVSLFSCGLVREKCDLGGPCVPCLSGKSAILVGPVYHACQGKVRFWWALCTVFVCSLVMEDTKLFRFTD